MAMGWRAWDACASITARGMNAGTRWTTEAKESKWLGAMEATYEAYRSSPLDAAATPTTAIPKLVHFIWLGGPMPPFQQRLVEGWKTMLLGDGTGWEVRLWGSSDVEGLKLRNAAAYERAQNYGEKSDIARYEILLRYGGVYVDCDFLAIQSLTTLHELGCLFYAGMSNTGTAEVNNGFIGCTAGHPLLERLVQEIAASSEAASRPPSTDSSSSSSDKAEKAGATGPSSPAAADFSPLSLLSLQTDVPDIAQHMSAFLGGADLKNVSTATIPQFGKSDKEGTISRTGPGLLTRSIVRHFLTEGEVGNSGGKKLGDGARGGVLILPTPFFYPMPNNVSLDLHGGGGLCDAEARKYAQPESFAVHMWARSWQATQAEQQQCGGGRDGPPAKS